MNVTLTLTTLNFILLDNESNQISTILTMRTRRNYLMHANFESLRLKKKRPYSLSKTFLFCEQAIGLNASNW